MLITPKNNCSQTGCINAFNKSEYHSLESPFLDDAIRNMCCVECFYTRWTHQCRSCGSAFRLADFNGIDAEYDAECNRCPDCELQREYEGEVCIIHPERRAAGKDGNEFVCKRCLDSINDG